MSEVLEIQSLRGETWFFQTPVTVQHNVPTADPHTNQPLANWLPFAGYQNVPANLKSLTGSLRYQPEYQAYKNLTRIMLNRYAPDITKAMRVYVPSTGQTYVIREVQHDTARILTTLLTEDYAL